MTRRRLLNLVGAAVALGAGGWVAAAVTSRTDGDLVSVERRDLVVGVAVTGTLRAVHADLLGPPQIGETWNFKISFLAPEGASVRAGTPVLRFDTAELDRKLLEAVAARDAAAQELKKEETAGQRRRDDLESQLAEAQARLRKAELKTTVPAELAAAQELATARIDRDLARKEVASIEGRIAAADHRSAAELAAQRDERDRAAARVEEDRGAIERMTVTAPRDGTVILVDRRGEKSKVGDTIWRMNKVVEIPDLTRMLAEGEVDEADAGRVAVGQPASFALDAHPDLTYHGRISAIHRVVEWRSTASRLRVVRLELEIDDTDAARMRPGMRFQGTIEVDRAVAVVAAPADAVFGSTAGPVAYRQGLWGLEAVPLAVGRRSGEWVEVVSGLAAGDRLARRPPQEREEVR